jgi:hypothetical protein
VYIATASGSSPLSNSLIALEPITLKQKAIVSVPDAGFNSSPLVFQWKDKDVVAAAGKGKLYLFDTTACARELDGWPEHAVDRGAIRSRHRDVQGDGRRR